MRRDVAWASSPHAPLPGPKENQNQRRKEGRGEGDRERERQKGRKQAKGTMMRCVTQSGYAMCDKLFLSLYTKGDVKPLHIVFSTIEVLTPTCRILLCSRSQVSLPWFCDSWAPRRAAKRIFCMRFHLAPAGHPVRRSPRRVLGPGTSCVSYNSSGSGWGNGQWEASRLCSNRLVHLMLQWISQAGTSELDRIWLGLVRTQGSLQRPPTHRARPRTASLTLHDRRRQGRPRTYTHTQTHILIHKCAYQSNRTRRWQKFPK